LTVADFIRREMIMMCFFVMGSQFYTYEGLKLWALSWQEGSAPLSTTQTLAIGGIAGSTAAFFTTPFDVIKTRLQTQAELQSDLWVEGW
jgi:hypothetical protein